MSYCRFRVMADSTPTLKQRLAGRSLYLVGMMGSGKTSTGRPLAERLGYGFVDADAVIEQAAGCSIPDIFDRDGEAGFRSLESQVLSAISLAPLAGGGHRWRCGDPAGELGNAPQRHRDLARCGARSVAAAAER